MTAAITTILWDVGGTLMDWATPADESLARAFRECGLDPALLSAVTVERARREFALDEPSWRTADDERAGWQRHAAALLADARACERDVARLGEKLAKCFEAYAPIDQIGELLAELSAAGFKQGVVSNWPPSLLTALRHHDLARHFATITCSADFGILKPDPALFIAALIALGSGPEGAVFIGNDPLLDIAPARALGMQTIHFDPRRQYDDRQAADVRELRAVLGPLVGLAERIY